MRKDTWKKKKPKELLPELQKIFNKYIRTRDADENGICECISCGKKVHLGTINCQAGHFIPISVSSQLRFNEYNVNVQCSQCNKYKEGNTVNYEQGLRDKYGDDILQELKSNYHEAVKWDVDWLVDQMFYYKKATEEIEIAKGLK